MRKNWFKNKTPPIRGLNENFEVALLSLTAKKLLLTFLNLFERMMHTTATQNWKRVFYWRKR
jgi:hypothetical protein